MKQPKALHVVKAMLYRGSLLLLLLLPLPLPLLLVALS
jgi:hypothetical protein